MLRFLTAGESHGPSLSVIVEGLPAGLAVSAESIGDELARRRLGYGRGPRMRFERDELRIIGGVRHGRTLGSPVAIEILNSEWPKWEQEMSAAPGAPSDRLTTPRPGHADLAGMQKYAFDDARDVLERASARETAARVVAGALAKALLATIGIDVVSHVVRIGSAAVTNDLRPAPGDLDEVDASEVRCFDADGALRMIAEIKAAAKEGDSLGGIAEVIAYGVPVGLGSYVHWDRKLDGLLAGALMSIQAVKAVEIGDGMAQASQRGSVAHDAIAVDAGFGQGGGYIRRCDRGTGAWSGHRGNDGAGARGRGPSEIWWRLRRGVHAQSRHVPRAPWFDCVCGAADLTMARLVLVGLPGVGKTSVAEKLADLWGCQFVDTDELVAAVHGKPSAEILREDGESVFRDLELAALSGAVDLDAVIATGGGVVTT